ncbi:LysE family translocator [uncultured Desulfovibrio sp.]|uniref:LysE family translocator n=1 Tax=uncultured Desulfovibrio sp. TaxID=167968 RepID=UPI002627EFAD|nr:LysE family translocator [uncultured Desulfovibrio sp.]
MIPLDVALAFFGAAVVLALIPGPDILFVLSQSALYGARAGVCTTLGLASGLVVHTSAVALGVAVIFQTSAVAFTLLKTAGAAYLLYLAWLSFRAGAVLAGTGKVDFLGYGALYRRGIIMNVTNPKVTLFFLAFLPQFCDPARGSVAAQVGMLGALFMLATLIVFSSVAVAGGAVAARFNRSQKAQILLHRCAGVIFVGLALLLLFSHR